MNPPIRMSWDGEALRPISPYWSRRADEQLVIGEAYSVTAEYGRSEKSHGHQFAFVAEAWKHLPENLKDEYPTSEHLRKRALIDAGFYDEQIVDAGSQAAALRVAAMVRGRPGEEFSLVITRGPVVVIRTAKSQSKRAMGGADFQRSKSAVLEIVSEMIGIAPAKLQDEAARAAA
jgi:hypothetical protein